jgi:hypothetical protein
MIRYRYSIDTSGIKAEPDTNDDQEILGEIDLN